MQFIVRLFALSFLALGAAHTAHAQVSLGNPLPSADLVARIGLERAWSGQATLNPRRDKISRFTFDEDLVYVQASSGVITAFDAETGRKAWAIQLGQFEEPSFPAVSYDEEVMVVVGPSLYAVDKATGATRWKLRLPGAPSTGVTVDEKQVYLGTLDGSVYAYNRARIRQLYQENLLPEWSNDALVWRFAAGQEITSPPVVTSRGILFPSRSGSVFHVTASSRDLQFQLETSAPIDQPAGVGIQSNLLTGKISRTIYVGSRDRTFYAIDGGTGKVKWDFILPAPLSKRPVAVGPQVFLSPDLTGLLVLNAADGTVMWPANQLVSLLGIAGETAYVSDLGNHLVAVNRQTGAISGSINLQQYTQRLSNELTDRLYLATPSGIVVCLRQIGRRYPVYYQHPERLPLIPEFAPDEDAPANNDGMPKTGDAPTEAEPATEAVN